MTKDRPSADFIDACRRAGVEPSDVGRLWTVHESWRGGPVSGAERLQEILSDYALWQLFRRSREGDQAAARRFERHWTAYINASLRWRATPEQIEEYRSQFFERVYRLVGVSFSWTVPFSVYLRTVLLNVTRTEGRREGRRRRREESLDQERDGDRKPREIPSPASTPEQEALQAERSRRVWQVLRELPPVDRVILWESLVEGVSGLELSKRLGLKRDAVYKRLQRGRARLRQRLEGEDLLSNP